MTATTTRIAGRTHAEWVEFAKRDDAMANMIPSDLRKILAAFGPVVDTAAEATAAEATVAALEDDTDLFSRCYRAMMLAMKLLDADQGHGPTLSLLADCRVDIERRTEARRARKALATIQGKNP